MTWGLPLVDTLLSRLAATTAISTHECEIEFLLLLTLGKIPVIVNLLIDTDARLVARSAQRRQISVLNRSGHSTRWTVVVVTAATTATFHHQIL